MNRERTIWTAVFILAGCFLLYRAALSPVGMARVYVRPASATQPTSFVLTQASDPRAVLSVPRTVGIWFAAFFTLAIFSFLYRDNPFYRFAEAVMVGVSAGYVMVAGFWDGIVPKLLARLAPAQMTWAIPSLKSNAPDWLALIPLALCLMVLCRLLPRGGWIARWPLAFIVGTYAGIRLISYLEADFVSQIRNSIVPLVVFTQAGRFDLWESVRNTLCLVGVLSALTYFYFSADHTGITGR
ncbi:MAG: hypothetical protein EHM42_06600, partial [Planctomycetaceae bacterium]